MSVTPVAASVVSLCGIRAMPGACRRRLIDHGLPHAKTAWFPNPYPPVPTHFSLSYRQDRPIRAPFLSTIFGSRAPRQAGAKLQRAELGYSFLKLDVLRNRFTLLVFGLKKQDSHGLSSSNPDNHS